MSAQTISLRLPEEEVAILNLLRQRAAHQNPNYSRSSAASFQESLG